MQLILADFGKLDLAAEESSGVSVKLKVFQGTQMKMENQILDFPTGICALYIDNNMPRTPGNNNNKFVCDIQRIQSSFMYTARAPKG